MAKGNAEHVRSSLIAGTWYPGAPSALKATVDSYLDRVDKMDLGGEIVGLISPHAGYTYSGQVAAFAYKQIYGAPFSRVVIVSPLHRLDAGRFVTTADQYYETPLGRVEVDQEMLREMSVQVELVGVRQDNEHSLEIQLPFLQRLLTKFTLVPLMMGEQDFASAQALAKAITQAMGAENTLLVASTDLSHFHAHRRANILDQVFVSDVEAYAPEKLAQDLEAGNTEACGGGPVVAVMLAAQRLGANRAQILKYATSGDVTGDHSNVVGYASGVLLRTNPRG